MPHPVPNASHASSTVPASPRVRARRIVLPGLAAVGIIGAFLGVAAQVATPPDDTDRERSGLSIVVRTPQHLESAAAVPSTVDRFAARGVTRAFVQVKQDETDEFPSGTVFSPSRMAPVAPGYADGRLATFTQTLARRGIAPQGWMPVLNDAQAAKTHPEWQSQKITADGRLEDEPGWLCPFNPAVAEYEASVASEIVATLPDLTGLYLDFIRYDDDFSCAGPDAFTALEKRTKWRAKMGRPLVPMDIRTAYDSQNWLWTEWTNMRAEKIAETVDIIRDAVDEVRPDFRMGAFVLPFSTESYEQNTQAGQDLTRLARAGLDEIVLMGYWDDWGHNPTWVREGLDAAARLVGEEADLTVVLDGDMGVRRTRLTLEAVGDWADDASYFNYDNWSDTEFTRLIRAVDGHSKEGPMPRPDHVSVVIRVDTEPDYQPSYDAVRPEMIDALVEMFGAEKIAATFITVGKLAERQTAAVRRAASAGHEIGSHSYDHEQLDSLPVDQQVRVVDRGLTSLRNLGFDVRGFGAPRNSITSESRDVLIDANLEYDGSDAYDPLNSLIDVRYERHSAGGDKRIVVIPFIIPNDWDAQFVGDMSAAQTLEAWTTRLDRVVASGEPVFVLDVHQWAVSTPENLAVLRSFIQYAKKCDTCRVETLREAAQNARTVLDRYELPAPTSGTQTADPASGTVAP